MKKLRKLLAAVSAAVLAVCSVSASAFAADEIHVPTGEERVARGFEPVYALGEDLSLYSLGDVDMDGEVTAYDAMVILDQFLFSMLGFPDILTADQLKLADLDGKGVWSFIDANRWLSVTAMDGTLTLTYVALRNAGFEMTMEEFLAEELK